MPDPNTEPNPEGSLEEKASEEKALSASEAPEEGRAAPAAQAAAAPASVEVRDAAESDKPLPPAVSGVGVVTPKPNTPGVGGAVLEWFWQGRAVQAVRARGTTLTPRGQELLRRARLAHELGGRALEPQEPLPSGNGDAIACELYRESLEWSLAAHQEQGVGTTKSSSISTSRDLGELWDAADPTFLTKMAGKGPEASKLRGEVVGRTFRDFAELESAEQARLGRALRLSAENATTALDATQNELDRIWLRRVVRLGALALAVVALVILISKTTSWAETGKDLASDADWSVSSLYVAEPGCPAPSQECAASPNFFIHTNQEESPWLMFDMKAPKSISAVRVDNRLDCCYDRAIPLIVEVSDDAKTWKEVARRTTDFSSWKAEFPTTRTRYVRLRIPKLTNLHFSRVRLLP